MKHLFARTRRVGSCLEWTAGLNNGYPECWYYGRKCQVTHLVWAFHFGEIPDGYHITQICENPRCINPAHLAITNAIPNGLERNKMRAGEQNRSARLTWAQVIFARNMYSYAHATQTELAALLGVTQGTISRAIRKETWNGEL